MTLAQFLEVVDKDTEIDVWGRDIDTKNSVSLDIKENPELEEARVIDIKAIMADFIDVTVDVEVERVGSEINYYLD